MPGADFQPIDMALLLASLAAKAADIETTKKALASGGSEFNPFMRGKPSNKDLNIAGMLAAAVQIGAAVNLPKKQRRPFLAGMLAMETALAHQNTKGRQHKNFADAMKRPVAAGLIAALLGHVLLGDDGPMLTVSSGKVPAIKLEMKF